MPRPMGNPNGKIESPTDFKSAMKKLIKNLNKFVSLFTKCSAFLVSPGLKLQIFCLMVATAPLSRAFLFSRSAVLTCV